ncbi:hypothetical protein HETIRDRAFT_420333 [Heterobasidion irregulare TC 32-1]|uniref:VPS9 domain-containing protein n=1 Tax=Heterobasidion irregulare (strain TC 32-1) TaxID=747525 RepID=W4K1E8_HETIT|nr:uncharacterized protein HETIRDRAFT_420333 [Heterobasidion irregulare TC 32-1]ETW79165.1 hypothetical protein HETIRDRAFT_420333 [Heterobasidion irregulare TC 32-1]
MAEKRDNLFPSGSIGRVHGSQLQRASSPSPSLTREPLTAHPLLSPTPSSTAVNTADSVEVHGVSTAPRYVPYTPRHRTAAATTGTSLQSSVTVSPQQQNGGATSKLQLMNLKAGAQSVGLDTGSVGWEILEKLVGEHNHSPDWSDIWTALTTGKATLLLPLESGSHEDITADFMKDHIALCDGASRNNASMVTLSGLRGVLVDQTLTLRSSLRPGSKPFEALLVPSTRASALASLPPLPPTSSSPFSQTYPTFTLTSHTSTLPLIPHITTKPPLPPRTAQRSVSSQATSSRLSTSFASLFGKSSTPSTPSPTSAALPETEHATDVNAFSIDRRIVRKDVTKHINRALKAEIKETLSVSGAPPWVVDRVNEFTAGLYPFTKGLPHSKGPFSHGESGSPPSPVYIIDPPKETPEELSQQFQDFYDILEEELHTAKSPTTARPRNESFEAEQEKKANTNYTDEVWIRDILEAVERVTCSLFYDRLYLQPTSDDASHDEALSSRVAALNMLDLGLEHLGVDVGSSSSDVQLVLKGCGETLSQLEESACRCPADKAAILVAAHKILVDGLSRLPPIRLKSEAELEHQKTPRASSGSTANGITNSGSEQISDVPETALLMTGMDMPPPIVVSPESDLAMRIPSPISNDTTTLDIQSSPSTLSISLLDPRPPSPRLTISPPPSPTPVSGDLILPLMIYAVVKSNPQHLVSHLLFTQRFRNQRFGGEESYCIVNIMAVADFLENVDLKALGLGESEKKVMSTADLTPIPVTRVALGAQSPTSPQGVPARLRGRVEQQVDAIAGSANKVISGVVDSSFGVLRALLPGTVDAQQAVASVIDQDAAPWNVARPGFGLLRRESGFSIASLAASLPGRERAKSINSTAAVEESGQMMVEVASRPGSVRSAYLSDAEESEEAESEEDEDEEDEEEDEEEGQDTRSIKSFESMMGKKHRRRNIKARKTLSDRLASMPGLSRLSGAQPTVGSPPASRRSSLLPAPPTSNRFDTPISSRPHSPIGIRLAPPNRRFLECSEDDLKVSEVRELLREYKRLAEGVRAMGGFEE